MGMPAQIAAQTTGKVHTQPCERCTAPTHLVAEDPAAAQRQEVVLQHRHRTVHTYQFTRQQEERGMHTVQACEGPKKPLQS